jgi:hypothetical protein
MEKYLKSDSWSVNHRCTCGGPLKEFYRNNQYKNIEVIVTQSQHAFEIRLRNTRIDYGKGKTNDEAKELLIEKLQKHGYAKVKDMGQTKS